jgi:peroxisomal membrane protein 2
MSNVVAIAWYRYLKSLEKHPVKTKAISSAVIAGVSDMTAQKLVSNAPLNWRRTLAMALFGLIWGGPSNHYWQLFTNRLLKGRKDTASVLQKMILDNCVYSPIYNLLIMTYIAAVVEGRSSAFVKAKLQQDLPTLQMNSWKVWPIVSIVNYKYVPLKLRVLVVQLLAFFWSTFVILQSRSAAAVVPRLKAT